MGSFRFGREGASQLELSFAADGLDPAYEGWRNATVKVVAGPFRADFRAELTLDELHPLRDDLRRLYRDLGATMTWETTEGWLQLEFTGDGRGHFELVCTVTPDLGGAERLTYSMHLDQTDLNDVERQLTGLLERLG